MKKILLAIFVSLISFSSAAASAANYEYDPNLTEGGPSTSMKMRFAVKPNQEVNITLNGNGQCEFSSKDSLFSSPLSIVSSGQNHFFEVKAIDDNLAEGSHQCNVDVKVSSNQDGYNYDDSIVFAIADNGDQSIDYRIDLVPEIKSDLLEGSDFLYGFRPTLSQPAQDPVFIEFISDNQCNLIVKAEDGEISVNSHEVVINNLKSDLIKVQPVDDEVYEGAHSCNISAQVSTIDQNYLGYQIAPISFDIADNDINLFVESTVDQTESNDQSFIDLNRDGINDYQQPQIAVFYNEMSRSFQAIELEDCEIIGSAIWRDGADFTSYDLPYGLTSFKSNCSGTTNISMYYQNTLADDLLLFNLVDETILDYERIDNKIDFSLSIDDDSQIYSIGLGYLSEQSSNQSLLARTSLGNYKNTAIFISGFSVVVLVAGSYFIQRAPLDMLYKRLKSRTLRKPRITQK